MLKFSIIIPVYNAVEYIEECLLSIINQDYPHVEIIVIDGSSDDGTVEIIKKYSDKISYWVSETDEGQSYAINKGLIKATGDIIAWLNADERYLLNTLQTVNSIMESEEIDLCYGNTKMINEKGTFSFIKKQPKYFPFLYMLLYGEVLPSDASFWKRELQDKIGLLNEKEFPRLSMDYDWFLRMSYLARKTKYINKTLSKRIDLTTASTNSTYYEILKKNRNQIITNFFKQNKWPLWISQMIIHFAIRIFPKISPSLIRRRNLLILIKKR